MATKIYTKTGDKGTTSLLGGTKVPKNDIRIEAYGTIDELNSFIGLVADNAIDKEINSFLREVQDRLFTIGSLLACDPDKKPGFKLPQLNDGDITQLEKKIDWMDGSLTPMKSFILPGGDSRISTIHIARTICRRAERACVNMQQHAMEVESAVIVYLNRLSDYLFVLARYTAHQLGISDIEWKPKL